MKSRNVKKNKNPVQWFLAQIKNHPLILFVTIAFIAISILLPLLGVSLPYITPLLGSLTFPSLGNAAIPISYLLTTIVTGIAGLLTSIFLGWTYDKIKYSYQVIKENNNQLHNHQEYLNKIDELGKSKRSFFIQKDDSNFQPSRKILHRYYAGFISDNKNITKVNKAALNDQLLWAHCSGWANIESKGRTFVPVTQIKRVFNERKLEIKSSDYIDAYGRKIDKERYKQSLTEMDNYWLEMSNTIEYLDKNERKLVEMKAGEIKGIAAEINHAMHEGIVHRKMMEKQITRVNQIRINSYALIGAALPEYDYELLFWYSFGKGLFGFQLEEDISLEIMQNKGVESFATLIHDKKSHLRDNDFYLNVLGEEEYNLIIKVKNYLEQALNYNNHYNIAIQNKKIARYAYQKGKYKARLIQLTIAVGIMECSAEQEAKEWEGHFDTLRELREKRQAILDDRRTIIETWDKNIAGYREIRNSYENISDTYREISESYRNIIKRYDVVNEGWVGVNKRLIRVDEELTSVEKIQKNINDGLIEIQEIQTSIKEDLRDTKEDLRDIREDLRDTRENLNDMKKIDAETKEILAETKLIRVDIWKRSENLDKEYLMLNDGIKKMGEELTAARKDLSSSIRIANQLLLENQQYLNEIKSERLAEENNNSNTNRITLTSASEYFSTETKSQQLDSKADGKAEAPIRLFDHPNNEVEEPTSMNQMSNGSVG